MEMKSEEDEKGGWRFMEICKSPIRRLVLNMLAEMLNDNVVDIAATTIQDNEESIVIYFHLDDMFDPASFLDLYNRCRVILSSLCVGHDEELKLLLYR
nr:hypothetical protein [Tanacetum cinerariifolium]